MFIAVAGLGMKWTGDNFDKMKEYVDRKNSTATYDKFCLVELDGWDWGLYQRNKNFYGCHPTVVYDPENVSKRVLRAMVPDFNFVRNFGGKSRD